MAWWMWLFKVFICACVCNARYLVEPRFKSISILNNELVSKNHQVYRRLSIEVTGENFHDGLKIKFTNHPSECHDDIYDTAQKTLLQPQFARFDADIPADNENPLYLCVQKQPTFAHSRNFDEQNVEWQFTGQSIFITPDANTDPTAHSKQKFDNHKRIRRHAKAKELRITGIRVESSEKEVQFGDDGVPIVLANLRVVLRVFGEGLVNNSVITFTRHLGQFNDSCQFPATSEFYIQIDDLNPKTARVTVTLPTADLKESFYMCAKQRSGSGSSEKDLMPFVHQGSEPWIQIRTYKKLLPVWVAAVIIGVCLLFSALFSGLNLGLMALNRTELKILCNTGNEKERQYAKIIQPVRDKGNYLLCSILLGNVLVNSIFTILLDDLTSGLVAVLCSTLAIVLFGEISPQAVCSRHGLMIGARTIYITKAVMFITAPLSFPISKILDVFLGEELGNVYNRERLKELVKVTTDTNDLDNDEVNIISGALELRKKCVGDVMTRLEDIFMLDYESILDFSTISEIMNSGFSRIPVFEGRRDNICMLLYIKDLAFVDPEDNRPLKSLCQFYRNPCNFIFEDVTLDVMFRQFKEGNKGHMAFVRSINNEGEGDPFYETVGLITLEDVIEELIQAEIMDETDVYTDNRSKRKRNSERARDFSIFAERRENHKLNISPPLVLAAFQYLSTSVAQFRPDSISETILRRLLKQDIFYQIKKRDRKNDNTLVIYEQGKSVDYFVLILEGRVEVTVGKENLIFESGPFTYFGIQALSQNVVIAESPEISYMGSSLHSLNVDALIKDTFSPDYTVRAATDVLYMRVRRSLYMAAKRATLMERSQNDSVSEQFDDEMEKLLHSSAYDEDDHSCGCKCPCSKASDEIKNMIISPTSNVTSVMPTRTSESISSPKVISPSSNAGVINPTSTRTGDVIANLKIISSTPNISSINSTSVSASDTNGTAKFLTDSTENAPEEEEALLKHKLEKS